jgi:hypothetical protein
VGKQASGGVMAGFLRWIEEQAVLRRLARIPVEFVVAGPVGAAEPSPSPR